MEKKNIPNAPRREYLGVSLNNGTPKSWIWIGFSIIFTIHFGDFPPIFGNIHVPNVAHFSPFM